MRPFLALAFALCATPAAAQTPVVACQIGAWQQLSSGLACRAFHAGAAFLRWPSAGNAGLPMCAIAMADFMPGGMSRPEADHFCAQILNANVEAGGRLPVR